MSCSFVLNFKSEHNHLGKEKSKTVVNVLIPKRAPTVFEEIIHRAVSKRIKGCILLPSGLIDCLKF